MATRFVPIFDSCFGGFGFEFLIKYYATDGLYGTAEIERVGIQQRRKTAYFRDQVEDDLNNVALVRTYIYLLTAFSRKQIGDTPSPQT